MPITLLTSNQQNVVVEDKPLANPGAEGAVHRIISPSQYKDRCVKLYFKDHRTRKREQKILYMTQNQPPGTNRSNNGGCTICFPNELVYEKTVSKRFAGFIMPLAYGGSQLLYELCVPKAKKLPDEWLRKYDRSAGDGVKSRLKLCVNIASAVNFIHNSGNYVFVDLKPQNMLVTADGKVSVIDLDSTQIVKHNQILYPAQFATPEYVPVEGNHLNPNKDLILETWDRFSLAVMFYEILFGLHPYSASFKDRYRDSTSVADSIKHGLFVYGSKKQYVYTRPIPHDNFARIPSSLQKLFMNAFDLGHTNPSARPKASEWGNTIYRELLNPSLHLRGFITIPKRKTPPRPKTYQPHPSITTTSTIQAKRPSSTTQPVATTVNTKPDKPLFGKVIVLVVVAAIILWIGSGILSFISNAIRTKPSSQQNTVSGNMRTVNTINLNVRYGPGKSYSIVSTFPEGSKLIAYGETRIVDGDYWVQVSTPDGRMRGWVNRKYLSP